MFNNRIFQGSKELYNRIVSYLQSWCNSTFAKASHTHTASQISGLTGGVGFPNYTSTITSGTGNWTATKNCWFIVYDLANGYGERYVYINSVCVGTVQRSFTEDRPTAAMIFPLTAGDKVTFGGSPACYWIAVNIR